MTRRPDGISRPIAGTSFGTSQGSSAVTFNGIGLWHDGFERKNGPLAWFYETRNFALANVLAVPLVILAPAV